MKYIGGYSILDLTDANVSAQALTCYNQDKPVLVYGTNGERYFADTITKSGTSIIITKGGKTITIANDNTITNVGDIQLHRYIIQIGGLNTQSDGTGDSVEIRFQYDTYKDLTIYNGVDTTKENVAEMIKDYNGIIAFDYENENVFGLYDYASTNGEFDGYPSFSAYVVENTGTITITKIF